MTNYKAAVQACLSLLDLAPDPITVPLFGAVYRAVLCELAPADVSVFLVGPTGVFKTEVSAARHATFGGIVRSAPSAGALVRDAQLPGTGGVRLQGCPACGR